MLLSRHPWKTRKEAPSDAEAASHRLMLRAGLIHKAAAGIYNLLPMGHRVLRRIEGVVREELGRIGSQEVLLSVVTPGELWRRSGRWDAMGEMLRFRDKRDRDLCISPTNEEAAVDLFSSVAGSYRDLPMSIYQINTKFRDEIRPRFGLMRGREFIMKDAYTFHMDEACLDRTYLDFHRAYGRILDRMDLEHIVVEADGGLMADGGQRTHEFQVTAGAGEDVVVRAGSWAANADGARTLRAGADDGAPDGKDDAPGEVATPGLHTVAGVCGRLGVRPSRILKSLLYEAWRGARREDVLAVVLGDDDLSETKLKSHLGCGRLSPMGADRMAELGFERGFVGPFGPSAKRVRVVVDGHVDPLAPYVTGANRRDAHLARFRPGRDGAPAETADLRAAREGDLAPDGSGPVEFCRGIEVGHIFQLGRKYTESMGVSVQDGEGRPVHPLMGCYGLGITRLPAAAVEQHHDERGIVWPKAIAPFHAHLVLVSRDPALGSRALDLHGRLGAAGLDVLLDDRDAGAGFKLKDADLLGVPLALVVGDRAWRDGRRVEWVERATGRREAVDPSELPGRVRAFHGLPP